MAAPGSPALSHDVRFVPLTEEHWPELEALFGERGACAGCWCMWWRLSAKEFTAGKGEANRAALRKLVAHGEEPGILALADGQPVGWCAVSPRRTLRRLERSRILKPVDERPAWSISCFFVARPWRRRGLSTALLRAACRYAFARGAEVVEGYPMEPRGESVPDAFAWHGLASAFRAAGFREAARRSDTRPIMRLEAAQGAEPRRD